MTPRPRARALAKFEHFYLNGCHPYTLAFCMGEKEVPIQNIWGNVTEISVTVDVCSGTVKYYILVRGTSEGDTSQSHISSHFAPIVVYLVVLL